MRKFLTFLAVVSFLAISSFAQAEYSLSCLTNCNPIFGPGIGVTCQAALSNTHVCLKRCYYENGYWLDAATGRYVRTPVPGGGDQRPSVRQVVPFGYPTAFGYLGNSSQECPGSVTGFRNPTPSNVYEFCTSTTYPAYGEGDSYCNQFQY